MIILILTIAIISAILNASVIILFIRQSTLRDNATNKFLLNLMITGLCITIIITIIALLKLAKVEIDSYRITHMSAVLISSIAFEMSLLLVTLDRFIAVQLPLRYRDILNTTRVHFLIGIVWVIIIIVIIIGIAMAHSNLPKKNRMNILITAMVALTLFSMLVLIGVNLVVFREVKRQIEFLISITISPDSSKSSRDIFKKQERRSAYLCFAMAFSFIICWLPGVIIGCVTLTDKNTNVNIMSITHTDLFLGIAGLLIALNMIFNPSIYVLLKEDVKLAIKNLLRSSYCSRRVSHFK